MPVDVAMPMLEATVSYNAVASMKMVKVPIRAINADLGPTNFEANRKYAPQFDAVIIKGVGHYPMLEDPAKFNEFLTGVLQDIARAKRTN